MKTRQTLAPLHIVDATVPSPMIQRGNVLITRVAEQPLAGESKAYAEIIVRAVNSHADLLAACKKAIHYADAQNGPDDWSEDVIRTLKQAIAKAEAKVEIDLA